MIWKRWKTPTWWLSALYLWFKTLYLWLNPLYLSIRWLFYGIFGDNWQIHNISAWRTWSRIPQVFEYRFFRSPLLENVKWLVEACSKWRCQDNFLTHYLTSQSPHLPNNPLFQTTPLPFTFRAPPMPGLRWRNPQLSHITLRPGGGGRIYTPYNYIWKPSRSWFRARSKKSPWGDYTSSGHAFIPLLVCRDAPAYEIWYDMVGALPVW